MTALVSPLQKPLFYSENHPASLNSDALSVASQAQSQTSKGDSLQDIPISAPFIAQLQEAARQEAAQIGELKNRRMESSATESTGKIPVQTADDRSEDNGFGFFDFLDIINPLQHIPVISNIYRETTGDGLHPTSRIFGGMLYGGVPGAVSSIINAITEDTTGKDIIGHITSVLFDDDERSHGTEKKDTTNSLPAEDLVAIVPPAPRQTPTAPTATTSVSRPPSDSSSFAYEGQDALTALYRDLHPTTAKTNPVSTPETEPRLSPTLAAFTQPREQGTATAHNANYFVDNGRKWFNLRQPGSNSLIKTVQIQSPSFQSTRPLLKNSVSKSIQQAIAPATANDPVIRNNTISQKARESYQKTGRQIKLSAPDDIATEMLHNPDRYKAPKVSSSTETNSL